MKWNQELRKKRQKKVTERIVETKRKKPSVTLPKVNKQKPDEHAVGAHATREIDPDT